MTSDPLLVGNGVYVGTEGSDQYAVDLTSMVNTFLNYFDAACATLGQQPTTGTYFSGDSVGEDPNANNPNAYTGHGIAVPVTKRGTQGGTGATNSDVTFISVGSVTGDNFGKKGVDDGYEINFYLNLYNAILKYGWQSSDSIDNEKLSTISSPLRKRKLEKI